MNYIFIPSLEHIALVKIASTLWNQEDIRALMAEFRNSSLRYDIKKWQDIEKKVVEKVPHLSQLESLNEEIECFIEPIGLQILKWMEYIEKCNRLCIDLPKELCWTCRGTLDKRKTVEVLIKDESTDIADRYTLACVYCLENDIPKLWNKVPEHRRKYFYGEQDPRKVGQHELVVLWTYDIMGEVAKMDKLFDNSSPYQYGFEYGATVGNKEATECFFQKLTPKERKDSLVRSAVCLVKSDFCLVYQLYFPEEYYADILCFLLSQMDREQQIEVFKSQSHKVLKYLLNWPWQSLFMGTVNLMWDFLSEWDYMVSLHTIIGRVQLGFEDFNYQELFREFWQQSTGAHKRYVINKCADESGLLSDLVEIKHEKNFKLILKDATPIEKKELILSHMGKEFCEYLIEGEMWDLLKFFIRECISSRKEMIKFKEELEPFLTWQYSEEHLAKHKGKHHRLFQLLDEFICGYDKRKSVDENGGSAKRHHTTDRV